MRNRRVENPVIEEGFSPTHLLWVTDVEGFGPFDVLLTLISILHPQPLRLLLQSLHKDLLHWGLPSVLSPSLPDPFCLTCRSFSPFPVPSLGLPSPTSRTRSVPHPALPPS